MNSKSDLNYIAKKVISIAKQSVLSKMLECFQISNDLRFFKIQIYKEILKYLRSIFEWKCSQKVKIVFKSFSI